MKIIVFLAVALTSLSAAAAVQQTELDGKVRRGGQEVVIPAGETVQGDLIATAGTVRVDGRVDGDLVASGGQVTVAGTVTGDVLVAAGSTTISAEIGGDLIFGAGRVQMDGAVAGSVLGSTGNYARGGSVSGTERVNVEQPEAEPEPTVADRAVDALRR